MVKNKAQNNIWDGQSDRLDKNDRNRYARILDEY
jgi:hypothetical protein